jgi:hypothetical protein
VTDIVYGIRITGEASGAKKAFEDTRQAQEKLTGAGKESVSAGVELERGNERQTATLSRLRLGLLAVGAAAVATWRSAVNAAIEAERAQNRLAAVIHATGGAAGIASGEYAAMAQSLMEATQFDDNSLINAQAELLKFGNIHGEVFRNALRLSADLAAFMGTDVPSAAQMLGKSLQSPTEGLMFMERQFGKLTDAETAHINKLVAQGRAWEAQNAVLTLWEKKVAGAAQIMNTGLGAATGDVAKQFNALLETMGKSGTIMNSTLQGGASLLKDIKLTLEGTRNPLTDLANETLRWVSYLKFVPGLGVVGLMAERARAATSMGARTSTGKINYGGGEEEAGLAAYAGSIALGGAKAVAAETAAGLGSSLEAQQAIMDEANSLGNEFLKLQETKRLALEKEADAVRDTLDPWNAYAREVERLRGLMEKGVISEREFGDAVALQAKKVGDSLDVMAEKGTQNFDELKQAIEGWGQGLSRELARGEVSLRSFGSLFEELLAMQIQDRLMKPFLNKGTEFLGELFNTTGVQSASQMAAYQAAGAYTGNAAPFHSGGIVGLEGGAPRIVHTGFDVPRFHSGLMPDEFPAVLQRGEGVFTPGQMRAMGGAAPVVKIEVNNQAGPVTARQEGAPRFDGKQWIVGVVLSALATDGNFRASLASALNKPQH